MHFECLHLDDQLVSRSSMPGQLKLKTGRPSSFTTIKCTANDLLFLNQPQARMKTPAVPPPVLSPIASELQLITTAFCCAPHHRHQLSHYMPVTPLQIMQISNRPLRPYRTFFLLQILLLHM